LVRTHKDLDVWQKAIDFVTRIYKSTDSFPNRENYGLTSQIRRSAVSIPSNIAEGAARKSPSEFRQFLYIALASASELETQLIIANNLEYLKDNESQTLIGELFSISRMLQGLIKSITK
jgi:four helix bundle protein